jgi:hypothetical protein
MNLNLKAIGFAAAATAIVATAVKDASTIRKQARKEREEIDANLQLDLSAIHEARGRILERIDAGKYEARTGKVFEQIQTDLKFYTIVAREGK